MTDKVSVIIPSRKEPYVRETVKDVFDNAAGEIEVLLILDGWKPDFRIYNRKGLKILRNDTPQGMRPCINEAVKVATGKYIMKLDAHCSIGEGWDETLKAECADNWIVVPRRYRWDAPNWKFYVDKYGKSEAYDFMTYKYPFARPYFPRLTCRPDRYRAQTHATILLDEDMGFQGSCWFMHKEHFTKRIGFMDTKGYGTFGEEPQELGLKTQLGPWEGAVMRNKKTWYAHWSKPGIHWRTPPEEAGRVTDHERENAYVYSFVFWWHNRWTERKHDFEWLVDKFWPLENWPDNWRWETKQFNRFKLEELWPTLRQHK